MASFGQRSSQKKQVMQSSRKVTRAFAPQVMQRMLSVQRVNDVEAAPDFPEALGRNGGRSLRGAVSMPSPGRFSAIRRFSSRSLCRCAPCMSRSMEMAASRPPAMALMTEAGPVTASPPRTHSIPRCRR